MFALGWGAMLWQTHLNRLSKLLEALCSITDECGQVVGEEQPWEAS